MRYKKYPIVFSIEMIRTILEDRKTQTRRIEELHKINHNPDDYICFFNPSYNGFDFHDAHYIDEILYFAVKCPYGKIKDKLWSRRKENGLFALEEKDASIWLEITNIRVERLQTISEEDIKAEGLNNRQQFRDLWNRINKKYSWEINPWVWVIEFKRI